MNEPVNYGDGGWAACCDVPGRMEWATDTDHLLSAWLILMRNAMEITLAAGVPDYDREMSYINMLVTDRATRAYFPGLMGVDPVFDSVYTEYLLDKFISVWVVT